MRFSTAAVLSVLVSALMLGACSGSEAYRGEWKATAADGSKAEITFSEKSFTVKAENGGQTVYEYTQNQYQYQNGRTNYGINIKNGASLQIVFPFQNNTERAAIVAPDDSILYTLGRNAYIPTEQFWQLPR